MSGSAKAGTSAERRTCELRDSEISCARSPERALGEVFLPLTKTYMEVGKPSLTRIREELLVVRA
jgi:hypothetical protein